MKNYFVINPAAGKGNTAKSLPQSIREICSRRGDDFEIYITECAGDVSHYIGKICALSGGEPIRIYACGGDGTLCEVAGASVKYKNATVGLIPCGTGNDFARNFTPRELFFDIGAQLDGTALPMDILSCNDMFSVNMINIGFDCEVVKKKEKIKANPLIPGRLAYVAGLILTLIKKPGVNVRVSANGGEYRRMKLLLMTIANGCYCGGGFFSNPRALLTDGMIDLLLIDNVSRTKFVSLVGSYKKGEHLVPRNLDILHPIQCSTLELEFDAPQAISVDGEITHVDRLCVSVMRGTLNFIVPAGCDFVKRENRELLPRNAEEYV